MFWCLNCMGYELCFLPEKKWCLNSYCICQKQYTDQVLWTRRCRGPGGKKLDSVPSERQAIKRSWSETVLQESNQWCSYGCQRSTQRGDQSTDKRQHWGSGHTPTMIGKTATQLVKHNSTITNEIRGMVLGGWLLGHRSRHAFQGQYFWWTWNEYSLLYCRYWFWVSWAVLLWAVRSQNKNLKVGVRTSWNTASFLEKGGV